MHFPTAMHNNIGNAERSDLELVYHRTPANRVAHIQAVCVTSIFLTDSQRKLKIARGTSIRIQRLYIWGPNMVRLNFHCALKILLHRSNGPKPYATRGLVSGERIP